MSRIKDWFFGTPIELKLKAKFDDSQSKVMMPKAPPLDYTGGSLQIHAKKSELVYSCIDKKAQAATDPFLIVERRNADGDYEADIGHPAAALFHFPNPFEGGDSFLRAWIAAENIVGMFAAEIVKSNLGLPVQLYPLIPTNLVPQYRNNGSGEYLDHYIYTINGRSVRFQPEELMIRRRESLGSMLSGATPLSVALGSVDADIASNEYIRAFYNNGGAPSGVLNITGRQMSPDDIKRYREEWHGQYSRYGKNRGGIAIMDGSVMNYQPIGQADLTKLNSESLTSIDESRICMAFGVPPILIGAFVGLVHVNQRASVREAQEDFWMNTMSPELKSIRKFLDRTILPYFEDIDAIKRDEVRFNWDMSQVKALQEDIDKIHNRAAVGYKSGIYRLNEARSAVGLDAVEGDEGESFYKAPPTFGTNDAEKKLLVQIADPDAQPIKGLLPEPEKKTSELVLSREPNEIEQMIDLKKIDEDQQTESERLYSILLALRNALIAAAVDAYQSIADEDISQLIIAPPIDIYNKIKKILRTAFINGQLQVISEFVAQGAEFEDIAASAIGTAAEEHIERITDLTVSDAVNEVRSRAINQIITFGILGISAVEIITMLKDELESQSDAWVRLDASSSVNASTQRGRDHEQEARKELGQIYIYSGILDKRICVPCKRWDGQASADRSLLPYTPNPKCKGRKNCRCVVITVYAGDTFIPTENEVR